jgi:predicted helicase
VFGIQAGVAIAFCVKLPVEPGEKRNCRIFYIDQPEMATAKEKLRFLAESSLKLLAKSEMTRIRPDAKQNWIHQTDNDFDQLLPLVDKEVKAGRGDRCVFRLFSAGVKTQRDEWVYDFSRESLEQKVNYMIAAYQERLKTGKRRESLDIKWDHETEKYLDRKISKKYEAENIRKSMYRPYVHAWLYFDHHFNARSYQLPSMFPQKKSTNLGMYITESGSQKPFMVIGLDAIPDLHLVGAAASGRFVSLHTYDRDGNRRENITDWALQQFRENYQDAQIQRLDIFHYTYAVLHHPAYRQKYEINLKRDFPRLPLYADFWQWANWGRDLMDWHINYEAIEPYPLDRTDLPPDDTANPPKLKADKTNGTIQIDRLTTLSGIPAIAWDYKLGNRSAIEWVLDQHKEKTPKDPTIRELFNTYRFADYKERAIDLIRRVCTVSVKTMAIVQQMPAESVHQPRSS